MKATGIVRRIDDLGRVVIPKEIRRTMRIREGDPLEIFVDRDGEVILKKYSPIGELADFARECAESITESTGKIAFVTDRDSVIAVSGAAKKDYLGKNIGVLVEQAMEDRKLLINDYADGGAGRLGGIIREDAGEEIYRFNGEVIAPIVAQGDPVGAIVICCREGSLSQGLSEQKVAETAAGFLARQMIH